MSTMPRLSAVGVSVAALITSANASAQHYYAVVENLNTNSILASSGDSVWLQTNILHSTCNIFTHNFVNHELWFGVSGNFAYWVEVGFKDGLTGGGGCTTDAIFWADNRNGGGYNEHYPNDSWSFNTWYAPAIDAIGVCEWQVSFNAGGFVLGNSTSNCAGTNRSLEAGIESTSQTTGSAKGYETNWYEADFNGVWQQGWEGPSAVAYDSNGNGVGNPRIQWLNSNTETEEVLNESF